MGVFDILEIIVNVAKAGLAMTLNVLVGSAILGYTIAFITGFCRLSKKGIIRHSATVFVEFFRGTSLLVQLFWLYFALPISPYLAAIIAIGLNYGAYMS